jgi:hypothetical protein
MQNTIIYLIGFAGTGKYTIAKEIYKLTGAKLVDNHLINNPVFSLIKQDGITPLPDSVWEKTWAIRHIVLDVIKNISPSDYSFIFTNVLIEGDKDDAKLFAEIEELAQVRKGRLIPVHLICEENELCRRIVSADRSERFKDISPDNARKKLREHEVLKVKHPNLLTLEVTNLAATRAAELIIQHVGESTL